MARCCRAGPEDDARLRMMRARSFPLAPMAFALVLPLFTGCSSDRVGEAVPTARGNETDGGNEHPDGGGGTSAECEAIAATCAVDQQICAVDSAGPHCEACPTGQYAAKET